ncbi:unnamed protein product [Lasius platythorax]|uniref:Uncharacterized protein n=1 Tax=Lasius platythorax TaxID=488582 RepID=A0AAV2NJH5_9HYME
MVKGRGEEQKDGNREAIRQYDGNTEDAEVWRGRVLLFRGLGAPTDVRANSRTHTHQRIAQTRGPCISSLGGVVPQCP